MFLGPSLSHDEARALLPWAEYRPPIARGDLPSVVALGARLVAIVDGVFHQRFPVSPSEIRDALRRGVRIYGASSMGALRAAEMDALGMIGIGRVYDWYRTGAIAADHEVGLIFDPDTGRALSVPLVNVRYALQRVVDEGLLDDAAAQRILAAAQTLHYTELQYPRILAAAGPSVLPAGHTPASFGARLARHDLKREDAILCLREVARASAVLTPYADNG